MKTFRFILIVVLQLLVLFRLHAQKPKPDTINGAIFRFEKFKSSPVRFYEEINQSKIKALRLSFRELSDTVAVNSFLFNPQIKDADRINLFDLLLWAIKEDKLTVYDNYSDSGFFRVPISGDNLKQIFKNYQDVIASRYAWPGEDAIKSDKNTQGVISYILMESTFYDKSNKVLAIRPIGLCPILSYLDEVIGSIRRRLLFWVYFPDIMPLLSNYYPEAKLKDVNTVLDYFIKNRYRGEYNRYQHSVSTLTDEWIEGDTATCYKNGFDVKWLYEKTKAGQFVNPFKRIFQGTRENDLKKINDLPPERPLSSMKAASTKDVYKIIDLRDTSNYPLYFPETPFRGQKSLMDVIYSGIKNNKFIVYQPVDQTTRMSPEEMEKAMGGGISVFPAPDNLQGLNKDTTFLKDITSSEVKKYVIKEQESYNDKGVLIDSKITGFIPEREYYEGNSEKAKTSLLFFVPFNDEGFIKLLAENEAYRFTIDENDSFLSFFLKRRYKAEPIKSLQYVIGQ